MSIRSIRKVVDRTRRKIPTAFQAGGLTAAYFCDALAMLGQTVLAARMMSRDQYGILALAMASGVVAAAVLDFRVWELMTISIPKLRAREQHRRAGGLVAGCLLLEAAGGLVAGSLLLVLSPWLAAGAAGSSTATPAFAIFAAQPLLHSIDEPLRTLVRLNGNYLRLAFWRAGSGVAQLIVVAAVLSVHPKATAVALAIVAAWCCRLLVLGVVSSRAASALQLDPFSRRSLPWIWPLLRRSRGVLGNTTVTAIAGRLSNRADILLLGFLTSPLTLAPYDLARRLISQLSLVSGPVEQVVYPKISILCSGSLDELKHFLKLLTAALAAFFGPLLVLVWIGFPWIIAHLFGDQYADASREGRILLFAYVPLPFLWLRPTLAVLGKTGVIASAGVATVVVQIAICVVFIPRFGGEAAAWAFVASQAFWLGSLASTFIAVNLARSRLRPSLG